VKGRVLLVLIAFNLALAGVLLWRAGELELRTAQHMWIERVLPAAASATTSSTATTRQTPPPLPTELGAAERRNIAVFRRASPSVVFITTLSIQRRHSLFGPRDMTAIPRGTGSGFIWDREGHIVTNYHVIHDGNAARVTLSNQREYRATLVGSAPDKDLAVLKIDAKEKLLPLQRGRSNALNVGQHVLAIGNPFGLDHTLSTGVISGLGREIKSMAGRPIQGAIQTDAAINPGNSGGPLLDSSGRLIGINTAIYSPSGASAGIGFAVPVDTVLRIVPQLIKHGRVIRPRMGIQIAEAHIARSVGVEGVLILGVLEGSPAERAGIKAPKRDVLSGDLVIGDVIVEFDGKPIAEPDDLFRMLDECAVGDTVKLGLQRDGKRRQVELKLASD
jgi:S1-C subfamily serine protease